MSVKRATAMSVTLIATLAGLLAVTTATASAAAGSDRLSRNQTLTANQSIHSADGRYVLIQQNDGNLVEYLSGRALWSTNTAGQRGARTVMQGDGNLVVYAASGRALFSTGTAGTAADTVIMQNDGNVVLYGGGRAWWASRGGLIAGAGDDYPAKWRNVAKDGVIDQWGYYNRECTSWVSWRLSSRNGFTMPRAIGNAKVNS